MIDHKFEIALTFTLQEEGGYSFDPQDPGGETNFGICKRSYPNLDIKNLTNDQAADIYYRDYWMAAGCYRVESETIAAKLFDLAVSAGVRLDKHTNCRGWVEKQVKCRVCTLRSRHDHH